MDSYCQNCRYCNTDHADETLEIAGRCQRYPPVFVGEQRRYEDSWRFPIVMDYDSCGEFRRTVAG